MVQWWQQPFVQVALPIIVTFILATWYQSGRINDLRDTLGKRIDDLRSDMNARFTGLSSEMNARFGSVEKRLDKLEEKLEGLQERSWR